MKRRIALLLWGLLVLISSAAQEICKLSLLIPFEDRRFMDYNPDDSLPFTRSIVSKEDHRRDGLTLLAVALNAIGDFNDRISWIDVDNCPVRLELDRLIDTQRLSKETVRKSQSLWLTNTTCSIIGTQDNYAARELANILYETNTNITAISYGATADILTDPYLYPNILLGTVAWKDIIRTLLDYLANFHQNNIGVMVLPNDNINTESDFVSVWEEASAESGVNIAIVSLVYERSDERFEQILKNFKERKVKTIVIALERDDNIKLLAQIAEGLGMLTDEYSWIMLDSFLSPTYVKNFDATNSSSPLNKLFSRSEILQVLDGFSSFIYLDSVDATNSLDTIWPGKEDKIMSQINSILKETEGLEEYVINASFFQNPPAKGASYLYDAIHAAGFSACTGEQLQDVNFDGVSGGRYYLRDGSLSPKDVNFGVFSIDVVQNSFQSKLKIYNKNGVWDVSQRYESMSNASLVIGLCFACLAITYSMISCYFVFHFRKNRIISIAQPEFLYMLCFGALLLALPIIFMSFDEQSWSVEALNNSCIVQTWLKFLGILIVNMALFSKLYRVEKVTQIRRGQRIHVKHVMKPFIALIVTALIILIVWTIVDPPYWTRDDVLVGYCHQELAFAIPLDVAIILSVSIALWWALKTKELPEDISDSRRVFQTFVSKFVVLIVGMALLGISHSINNADFAYLTNVAIAFAYSVFSISFLMIPKMFYVWRKEKTGEMPPSLQRGNIRVSGFPLRTDHSGLTRNHLRQSAAYSSSSANRSSTNTRLSTYTTDPTSKERTSGSTSSLGPQVSGDGSSKSLFGRKLAKAQPSDAEVIDS